VKRELSAGGVVLRASEGSVEVAVVSPRQGVLALPKGHPEPGESLEQAATREVREETGLVAEPAEQLGEVRYWYTLAGERVLKRVAFFLFAYRSGSIADHDDEVESAAWVPLERAPELLSYKGEREMAAKALALGQEPRTG
jgi:8-oxo-dGTP pyrophosphatase MutT (NUDIX family)